MLLTNFRKGSEIDIKQNKTTTQRLEDMFRIPQYPSVQNPARSGFSPVRSVASGRETTARGVSLLGYFYSP